MPKISRYKFLDHIIELKTRLIYCLCIYFIVTLICYFNAEKIYYFLVDPLTKIVGEAERKLIYTDLTEVFFTYVKLSFLTALVFCFPFFLFHFYKFLAPALYKNEKKVLLPYLILSPLLFLCGTFLVYYYVLPLVYKFFLSFETLGHKNLPLVLEAKVSEYLSLVISFIIAFGLAFQMPIVLNLLVRIGVIDVEFLSSKRRFAIIIIFCFAAVITPPDAISQIALAIPMVLLYELSILSCKWNRK